MHPSSHHVFGTVKTEIIETGARTSRISSFRLGGENTARKILQPSAETTDLTRRGNSNVLAPISIISVFTVTHEFPHSCNIEGITLDREFFGAENPVAVLHRNVKMGTINITERSINEYYCGGVVVPAE